MAPYQAVIVPIAGRDGSDVLEAAKRTYGQLREAGIRVKLDDRDGLRPGAKFADWEMRGVPLRIEIGANDLRDGVVTFVRRDREKGEEGAKTTCAASDAASRIPELMDDIQRSLYAQAHQFLHDHTIAPEDRDAFYRMCRERAGMIDIAWCERPECEAHIKAQTSATTRLLRAKHADDQVCLACGEPARVRAYFAQAY